MVHTKRNLAPVRTVVIANISEFYLPVYSQFSEKEKIAWTEPSNSKCDMALFWSGDDKLVITPYPVDHVFVANTCAVLGYENVRLMSPFKIGESLCADIEADPKLFSLLVDVLGSSERPQVIGWGATKPFYLLMDRLRQEGVEFTTPEIPALENYWTVPYVGSKCGFRDICTSLSAQVPHIRIPRGFVCADIDVAARIARSGAFLPDGIAVKANDGVGGYGTLLYSPGRFRKHSKIGDHLCASAELMPIFSYGTVIIEAYIESQSGSEIASPSIQGVIDPSGDVTIICLAAQIVGPRGRYAGALIDQSLFPPPLAKILHSVGYTIGEAISALGYRGAFSIDTVLDKDDQVYCVELNARRTSVKYAIDIATHLFGASSLDSIAIIISERSLPKQLAGNLYHKIHSTLSELLFPINNQPYGVILTIVSSLTHFYNRPQVEFIVFGKDMAEARSIHARSCKLLGNISQ